MIRHGDQVATGRETNNISQPVYDDGLPKSYLRQQGQIFKEELLEFGKCPYLLEIFKTWWSLSTF